MNKDHKDEIAEILEALQLRIDTEFAEHHDHDTCTELITKHGGIVNSANSGRECE